MSLPILPVVGSSGFYEFASPFDTVAVNNIEYTCKAVRRISDYLAMNEDIQKNVYEANNLASDIWDEDSKNDAYIVSLQSKTGHWVYLPYRYILAYPSVNGVQYRTMMIGVSLPSIPATQDLSAVEADVKDLVEHSLGLKVSVKHVETSRIILVPFATHQAKEQEREVIKATQSTYTAKMVKLRNENNALLAKIKELEAYIAVHHV